MKKLYMSIIIFLIIIVPVKAIYATDNTTQEQIETFGITDFINEANKYSGEFFEGVNVKEILNEAIEGNVNNSTIYKKIVSLLGKEVKETLSSVIGIVAIILIHSILRSISDGLENSNISKIIYYVQFILIVTIIIMNISDVISLVQDTIVNLVGFMNMLIPLLITLMLYTGSITTSSILEPIILFMINFLGNIIQELIIPMILLITTLCIVSKLSDQIQISKLTKFLKSGIIGILGILLTVFVGVVSLEGTLSSSVDGITAKTTKAVVSSAIPVVGKILGDAVDSVLGCTLVLKNAVGIFGVIIVVGICVMPIIKLIVIMFAYRLLSAVCEPITDSKIIDLLEQMGDIYKIFLAILCSMSVMIIVGITIVLKMSNAGMMYR